MTQPLIRNTVVVLHQIRSPDNLGAVARLIANFGARQLVLSDPRTQMFAAAQKMAVGAEGILDRMQVAKDLREALSQVVHACGTTSREVKGRTASPPEVAVRRLADKARGGPVALVFGGEKRGLSDEELALCQDVLVIPTQPEQPSMNLSQSAAVLLYLCSREGCVDPGAAGEEPRASLQALAALEARMSEALAQAGFLNPQSPQRILRELMRSLEKAGLTRREVELWLAAFDRLRHRRA